LDDFGADAFDRLGRVLDTNAQIRENSLRIKQEDALADCRECPGRSSFGSVSSLF
jgi:hypothetical protein